MRFDVSEEVEEYILASGKVFVNACPGSGKTTAIAYKLTQLIKKWKDSSNKFAGIACLSFTNTAKDEIAQKYRGFCQSLLTYPHLISTIDSFINHNITLPHYHLLEKKCRRPIILDDNNYLDRWNGRGSQRHTMRDGRPIRFSYKPSDIEWEIDGTFSYKGNIPDDKKVDIELFNNYSRTLKEWQLNFGLLKTTDSAFVALRLLKKYPQIAEYLTHRYQTIIVDEAQDTSEIQFEVLNNLANAGLKNLEFIGDPYQCLYQWRNARPDLLVQKTQDISQNWTTLHFKTNRRSTQRIIQCFSLLRQATEPKIASYNLSSENENPIAVLKYSTGNEVESVQKFMKFCNEYKSNRVVVRGTSLLNKLLGRSTSEETFWKSQVAHQIISAKLDFDKNLVKSAINRVRGLIPIIVDPNVEHAEKIAQIKNLKENHEINTWIIQLLRSIPDFNCTILDWTSKIENELSLSLGALLNQQLRVNLELKKDNKTKSKYSYSINEFIGTKLQWEIDISTIHQAKGMTFDCLMLILNENSLGQNISVKDLFTPTGFPTEKQRMIYVAMSRPRYLLAFGLPNTVSDLTVKETFGELVYIE